MSEISTCPFCDSRETTETSSLKVLSWKDSGKIINHYFPNFTYEDFNHLCNSCSNYVQEFCRNRKIWLDNENIIRAKRQIGHFKGLRDIVKLKNKSSVVCRLCFKENRLEDVVFIYLDNSELYRPGYLQEMLDKHANDIDFHLTENPVICQECLNAVQTFDALYQMGVENQACKSEPDFLMKSSSQDQDKVVHVQLQKSKDNSLVLKSVTEEESAVNSLIRYKESNDSSSNIVLNGWTMKKVFDIIGKPKKKKKIEEPPDVFVISDDEEVTETCENNKETIGTDPSNLEVTEASRHNTELTETSESHKEVVESNHEITNSSNQEITKELNPENKNVETVSDVIEIRDSDDEEDDTDLPKILSVSTITDTVQKHLPFKLDDLEDGEMVPKIIISMEAVEKLFKDNKQSTTDDPIVSNCLGETDIAVPAVDVVDSNSSSCVHRSKETLEENLSDFLQFNKNDTSNSMKRSNGDTSFETSKPSKKGKMSTTVLNDSETYSSYFERFALIEKVPLVADTAWKFLRGYIPHDFKENEFKTWFPYYPKNKKNYPSTRPVSSGTVLEDSTGVRIYRCDLCLKVEREEINMENHFCQSNRGRKIYKCEMNNCNFHTYNDFLIAQHKRAHMVLTDEEIKGFKCGQCDFFSVCTVALQDHITLNHPKLQTVDKLFTKCVYCFFRSNNPEILKHHMAIRHCHKKSKSKFTQKHFG